MFDFHPRRMTARMKERVTFSRPSLFAEPLKEPVTLTEAKLQLRVDFAADDSLLNSLIVTSRQAAELYSGRVFIDQTWDLFFDFLGSINDIPWWDGVQQGAITAFFPRQITIPKPPLDSIVEITSFDDDDVETVFDASNYQVSVYDGVNPPEGRVTLRRNATWPTSTRNADALKVRFIGGYGLLADDVPKQIRTAILEEIAYRYNNRGDCLDPAIKSSIAMGMLQQYKINFL